MRHSILVPAVLLEVPPELSNTREAASLVQACNSGLQHGECVLEIDRNGRSIDAVAIVHWSNREQSSARIDVGARQGTGMVWRSRELFFQEHDAALERWRSVGFVIATMARAVMPPPRKPGSSERATTPRGNVTAERPPTGVAIGGVLAWGAEPTGTRWGGWAAGSRELGWLRVVLRAEHLRMKAWQTVSLSWTSFAAGAGPQLELGRAGLLRAEVAIVGQLLQAGADEPDTGDEASDSRFLPGVAASVGWAWPLEGQLAGSVAVEGAHLSGATEIQSRGSRVGRSAASYALVRAGLELRF